jgi:predicted nuclease of predicted toxin-antitoxin system
LKGFLLDENLPYRLTFTPSQPFLHSTDLGACPSDDSVWKHAAINQLVIITKDADFSGLILVSSPPPWVVHLRFGNLRKKEFHDFMARTWPKIESLLPEHKLINVYLNKIEAIS